jgi:hypothetical protein
MNGIHILSTAPFFAKEPSGKFKLDKFDAYCAALSALVWRKSGDEITMVTDKRGELFLEQIGIADVWNGIEATLPENFGDEEIDPLMFWAAGKLFALRNCPAPIVMIDTDFITWKKPEFGENIIAAHSENLSDNIYPDISYFKMKPGYVFRKEFNYNALASNTAFLYIPDESFKQFYVASSLEFMKQAKTGPDRLRYMVYAEQRLLSMCAEYQNRSIEYLLDKEKLFMPQDGYTHLWGAKQALRDNEVERERFCARCRFRITGDFPEYRHIIDNIENAYRFIENG